MKIQRRKILRGERKERTTQEDPAWGRERKDHAGGPGEKKKRGRSPIVAFRVVGHIYVSRKKVNSPTVLMNSPDLPEPYI
mmetsp:Transcript_39563/g.46245  ORF Transcript_39563/g.46245 Transcript_39563/m.46245 type:complete len:80 (+) Transcript_39563:3-242(+)